MTGKEETLLVHGKRIQLFTGGGGAPLLYLHGAGTFWWMPVHDRLGQPAARVPAGASGVRRLGRL